MTLRQSHLYTSASEVTVKIIWSQFYCFICLFLDSHDCLLYDDAVT